MQSSLTPESIAAIFSVMVIGAIIPGVSVLTVTSRTVSSGLIHGVMVTLGIMLGDTIFIVLAIFGLSVLAESMGSFFVLVKYLGAAYLIWLGVLLWRSNVDPIAEERSADYSLSSSFLAGLFVTLGDQKAILFYFGFFPAFVELKMISLLDAGIVILMALVAIAGGKLAYALAANSIRKKISSKISDGINKFAGSVLMGVGLFIIVNT